MVGTESTWYRSLKMLVIVIVTHFDGNAVAVHAAAPSMIRMPDRNTTPRRRYARFCQILESVRGQ